MAWKVIPLMASAAPAVKEAKRRGIRIFQKMKGSELPGEGYKRDRRPMVFMPTKGTMRAMASEKRIAAVRMILREL
jgi:hypothetical protein